MALAMNYVFIPKSHIKDDDTRMPTSLSMVMSGMMTQPRDTFTGLFLAGTAAQNNRDWVAARENFDKLSEKYTAGSSNLLRSMTLSIGAGEFDQALKAAHKIRDEYLNNESNESTQESFDLVRLLLIAEAFKNQDYTAVRSLTENLNDGALSLFAKPIVETWVAAETKTDEPEKQLNQLSGLQLIYSAMAAEYAGDVNMAKTLFAKVANSTLTAQTVETLAAFYMRHDDKTKAIEILRRGLVQFPNNDHIRAAFGQLQEGGDEYVAPDFATTHLGGANSGMALAFADFARLMANERAIDSALLFARLATYLDNELPGIYMVIGDILSLQGQDDKALNAYQNVTNTDADFAAAQIEIAEILSNDNKRAEAIDKLQSVIQDSSIDAKANLYLTLANLYKADGQFEKAIDAYDIAEAKGLDEHNGEQPNWMWFLYYFRGVAFDMLDRHDEAEIDLKKALELEPENATLLNYLGYSYADKGHNLDAAYDMIARAVEQKPNDAYIVDSMGWVLYRMGRYDEAVEYLEQSAQIRPYNSVINDHLGDAYWKVGRRLEATYMWQRAVDYIPDNEVEMLDADDDEQAAAADRAAEKLKNGFQD